MALTDSQGRNLLTVPLPAPGGKPGSAVQAMVLVDAQGHPVDLSLTGILAHVTNVYVLDEPSQVWPINHGLNRYPSVTVVDSEGNVGIPDLDYHIDDPLLDKKVITLTFGHPFTGRAFLN